MEAPDGTAALNSYPSEVIMSASMVGLPLLSRISLALISYMVVANDLVDGCTALLNKIFDELSIYIFNELLNYKENTLQFVI